MRQSIPAVISITMIMVIYIGITSIWLKYFWAAFTCDNVCVAVTAIAKPQGTSACKFSSLIAVPISFIKMFDKLESVAAVSVNKISGTF